MTTDHWRRASVWGVSKQFGAGSLWMNTAAARGHLGIATLIRTCHMSQPASKDRGRMDIKLTPRDRAVQLGKEAHAALLSGLLLQALEQPGDADCGGGAPGHSRKALIVQLEPGEFGELGHAALDKLLAMEAAGGPECPLLAYKGISIGYGDSLPVD